MLVYIAFHHEIFLHNNPCPYLTHAVVIKAKYALFFEYFKCVSLGNGYNYIFTENYLEICNNCLQNLCLFANI